MCLLFKYGVLQQNPILKLQADCSRYTELTNLYTHHFNFLKLLKTLKLPNLKLLKLDHINIEQLDVANNKLDHYSRDLDDLINQPFIDKNISAFTYPTIAAIF